MTFYEFMMENYLGQDTAEGDLAEDMYQAGICFPSGGHRQIRTYLVRQGACPECLVTFERCWRDYKVSWERRWNG